MKLRYFFVILILLMIGLVSCQVDSANDKNVLRVISNDEPQQVTLLRETLLQSTTNRRAIRDILPISTKLAKDATLLVNGNPADIPLAGLYEGKRAVTQYFEDFTAKASISEATVQDNLLEGTHLNVHVRLHGYVYETGNTFDLEFVFAMTMVDDEISSIVVYYDTFNFRKAMVEMGNLTVTDVQNPTQPVSNPLDTNDYRPTVEAGIKAFFIDKDPVAIINLAHPDIYWVFKGDAATVPFVDLAHGHNELMQWLYTINANYYPLEITFHGSVQQGNRLDYFVEEHGFAIPTGKEFRIRMLHTYLMQDNKAIEFKSYNDSYAVSQAFIPD